MQLRRIVPRRIRLAPVCITFDSPSNSMHKREDQRKPPTTIGLILMFTRFVFASLDTSRTVKSTYSSALAKGTTDRYSRDQCLSSDYYYQALEFDVTRDGIYRIQSESIIQMYGCLYENTFNPSSPSSNVLKDNDGECGKDRLWLNSSLLDNRTYTLVVTTRFPGETGAFTIQAFGPATVNFKPISE